MTLENQVTSLELSKKLKELGVPQESIWYWRVPNEARREENAGSVLKLHPSLGGINLKDKWFDVFSAYTVAELGELLPTKYEQIKYYYSDIGNKWVCRLDYGTYPKGKHMEYANTEANARAAMLVYLLENKLIEV